MNRNIWIGIVVVVLLIMGGWWCFSQANTPAPSQSISQNTQDYTYINPGAQVSIDEKSMTIEPTSGTAPLKVTFSIAEGCANEEDLYFGDNPSHAEPGASNGFNGTWPSGGVTHTYTSPGTYTATLYCSMPNTLIGKTTITVH